jgi:hypothetical protein
MREGRKDIAMAGRLRMKWDMVGGMVRVFAGGMATDAGVLRDRFWGIVIWLAPVEARESRWSAA